MEIKFMWNGIKINKKLYRCHYSNGKLINYPEGTISIYAKDYRHIPRIEGLTIQNDTDTMTDYFEMDRIRILPTNKYYPLALQAIQAAEKHNEAIRAKRTLK